MPRTIIGTALLALSLAAPAAPAVIVGLNDPQTGNYQSEALELRRGALLAIERINRDGGVLGRPLELSTLNSSASPERAARNVERFAAQGIKMVFGGASSEEAISAGQRARELGVLYFPTLAYANEVTGKEGHRYVFRESNSAWMSAQVLGEYLTWHQPRRRYHYISLDDAWGASMEDALRRVTGSRDRARHGYTRIPTSSHRKHFAEAIAKARASEADVLVMVLLGRDLLQAMRLAHAEGLTQRMQVIVPNLTHSVVEQAGPTVMENVIGTVAWTWHAAASEQSAEGQTFVEHYVAEHGVYPGSTAASAYAIVRQWADAAQRAKSFEPERLVAALENHRYRLLKDEQQWRGFDHQNVQSIYAVKVRPRGDILKDPRRDYFSVIHRMSGDDAAPSHDDWAQERDDLALR